MTEIVKRSEIAEWRQLFEQTDFSEYGEACVEQIEKVKFLLSRIENGEQIIEPLFIGTVRRAEAAIHKVEADRQWKQNMSATMQRILAHAQEAERPKALRTPQALAKGKNNVIQ